MQGAPGMRPEVQPFGQQRQDGGFAGLVSGQQQAASEPLLRDRQGQPQGMDGQPFLPLDGQLLGQIGGDQ